MKKLILSSTIVLSLTSSLWAIPKSELERALEKNDVNAVKACLKKDPSSANREMSLWGYPLMLAVVSNDRQLVELLLQAGANPKAQNTGGETAFFYAESLQICQLLKSKGASLDQLDDNGNSALGEQASQGHLEIAKWMVSQGLKPDHINEDGDTLLHRAGSLAMAEYLLSLGGNVNAKNEAGQTPWMKSARNGDLEVLEYFLQHGADLKLRDDQGQSLLHLAASAGQLEAVQLALKSGLKADERNDFGQTPLHLTGESINAKDVIAPLLAAGAPLEGRDKQGRTALHVCANWRNSEVAKALLVSGAKVNAPDLHQRTPLHLAAIGRRVYNRVATETAIVGVLIKGGADPELRDELGKTASEWAVVARNWDFLDALSKATFDLDTREESTKP